tara:strand:+ start:2375 stop:2491 length:117 start_codon:yes stop_codon:yes gene_type:complete
VNWGRKIKSFCYKKRYRKALKKYWKVKRKEIIKKSIKK